MDPIANFLTSIRNAVGKGHEKTDVPFSKIKMGMAKVLKDEGYIAGYRLMEENQSSFIRIQLRYTETRQPIITGIKRVSKPGLHIYHNIRELSKDNVGMGIAILSTSKGIMTSQKARQNRVGGEVLCYVW